MPEPTFLPRLFDENSSHRLGCCAKKVPAAVPVFGLGRVDQTEPGIVNQSRGLQRLPRLFLSQFRCRQLPQLVVHQREKLFGSLRISLFDLIEDAGDVGHGLSMTIPAPADAN
jgi:hypothetical protein